MHCKSNYSAVGLWHGPFCSHLLLPQLRQTAVKSARQEQTPQKRNLPLSHQDKVLLPKPPTAEYSSGACSVLQHEVAVEHSSAPCYAVQSKRVVFPPLVNRGRPREVPHRAHLRLLFLTICLPVAERKTTSAQSLRQRGQAGPRTLLCLVPRG